MNLSLRHQSSSLVLQQNSMFEIKITVKRPFQSEITQAEQVTIMSF